MFLLQLQLDSTLSEEVLYFVLISCPLQNSSFLRYIMHAINTNWSKSNLESRISAGTTVSIIFTKKKTCSWSEKFRLRGKFPNVVSTSILFDCWRLLVETIFSMLNQNRNFRVTILNPERCIKYDRFKIRAFADQQNYQKYLFFLPRMMPLNTERKVFWKKLLL